MNVLKSSLLVLAILTAGCQDDEPEVESFEPIDHSEGLEEISLALNSNPNAGHGGYYAAQLSDYYVAAGLGVTIKPSDSNATVVQQIDRGEAMFGVTSADQMLLGRAEGAKVVAVLAPLQTSPRCIMVHEKSGIRSFEDLQDLTLAINSGATWAKFLQQKLPLSNVQIVDGPSVATFLADDGYAQQAYVFLEPFIAKENGGNPHSLLVSDLGFNPYTNVLITSEETLRKNPRLVQRMLGTCLWGWQQYLESPEETNRHIHELNPKMSLDILAFGAASMQSLCIDEKTPVEYLGRMTAERWNRLAQQLVEIGAVEEGAVNPAEAWSPDVYPGEETPK